VFISFIIYNSNEITEGKH